MSDPGRSFVLVVHSRASESRARPAINEVSTLMPGQSRQTGSFSVAKACGYHDHMNPDTASLQGVLLVGGAQDPGTHC